MEYDVRSELEFYDGDGQYVVGGLMRFANMSLDDAVDSVRASGGEVEQNYVDAVRASLEKPRRAARSE